MLYYLFIKMGFKIRNLTVLAECVNIKPVFGLLYFNKIEQTKIHFMIQNLRF